MNNQLKAAVEWLAEKTADLEFGEAVIRVTVHDGQVKQIERIVSEKIRE